MINPAKMAAQVMTPQSIAKSSGSGMLVGMTLPPGGGGGGPAPPTIPASNHPVVGSMGDCPYSQSAPLVGPTGSGPIPVSQSQSLVSTTASSQVPPAVGCGNQSTATMANMKEKTPMCLINELARYCKVQHQYRLVDESGPAHKKTFTVVLKLDNEEYTASGPSIKKAQHAAAEVALQQTKLKHPPPKNLRKTMGPVTPTVELNALAMKRGEPTIYQLLEPPPRPPYMSSFNYRGMYNQRYHYGKIPTTYCVSLKVGNREFFGEGRTAQAARHAAAEEALRVLRDLPLPDHVKKHDIPCNVSEDGSDTDKEGGAKSPISLVHEVALKRGLSVDFEVIRESGPPHMRTFITRCIVGETVTEGEGNGKKISKKRAAEKMLDHLKALPSINTTPQKVKKKPAVKKKSRNLIKEQKNDVACNGNQGINPISRLIQIQQAKKEREPVYSVIAERGDPRQREFIMQCSLNGVSSNGTGMNKKTAKRNAAESMLQMMGYSRPTTQQTKPQGVENQDDKNRKMNFMEQEGDKIDGEAKLGRQLVPGLLLMPDVTGLKGDKNQVQVYPTSVVNTGALHRSQGLIQSQDIANKLSVQTTSVIAKELLDTGMSPTAESMIKSGHTPAAPQTTVRPKQQLMYLAEVLGFQVHFTDFPKGNKMEFLSLVSLSTNPPQVSHGAGSTIEASHDQAALTALRALTELGLDSVTNGGKKEVVSSGGMTSDLTK